MKGNGRRRSTVERLQRMGMLDALGTAPCPWCGHALVARVGRGGPYFHCGCAREGPERVPPAVGAAAEAGAATAGVVKPAQTLSVEVARRAA